MDEIAQLGLAATASLALRNVFGPMTHEVGEALRRYTEHALRNVGAVVEIADRHRAGRGGDGVAPPPLRAAINLFEQAAYADDEVVREYLGGVLASARTPFGRDDRAVRYTARVARLSAYDLRAHYIWYRALRDLVAGTKFDVGDLVGLRRLEVYVPRDEFAAAMDFADDEDSGELEEDAAAHLHGEGLVIVRFSGGAELLTRFGLDYETGGTVFSPTVAGIDFFVWAMGFGGTPLDPTFIDPSLDWPTVEGIPATPGGRLRRGLPEGLR